MKYLIIALSSVVLILGFYCKSLKSDLEISEQNNKILESSIKVQDETISKLKDDYSKIQSANSELNELYQNQMKRFQIQNAISSFENSVLENSASNASNTSNTSKSSECSVSQGVSKKPKIQYSIYECYKNSKCEILR